MAFTLFGRKIVEDICMRVPKSQPKVIGSWPPGVSFRRNDRNGGYSLPSNQGACKCFGGLGCAPWILDSQECRPASRWGFLIWGAGDFRSCAAIAIVSADVAASSPAFQAQGDGATAPMHILATGGLSSLLAREPNFIRLSYRPTPLTTAQDDLK